MTIKKLSLSLLAAALLLGSAGHAAACGMRMDYAPRPEASTLIAQAARHEASGRPGKALRLYEQVRRQKWADAELRAIASSAADRLWEQLRTGVTKPAKKGGKRAPSKAGAIIATR